MTRISATDRLRRVLAIVPWIVAQPDGAPIDEVCTRFGLSREALLADLETVFLVGLYPYTPDALIDVIVEDDRVWIRLADYFARPLRLTPAEALALVATGKGLRDAPGADPGGPLARGLAKVARTLGVDPDTAVDIDLGPAAPTLLEDLQRAVAERRSVDLDYYSFGRDERTQRRVDPWRVYAVEGHWYLDGYCHLSGEQRVFRIDRIREATVTDVSFEPPDGLADLAGPVFRPRPDDPRVVLELAPSARWVVEQYPIEGSTEIDGGWLRVTLVVGSSGWLERLLLRLGPDVRVVDAPAGLRSAAVAAAQRVLGRYP